MKAAAAWLLLALWIGFQVVEAIINDRRAARRREQVKELRRAAQQRQAGS